VATPAQSSHRSRRIAAYRPAADKTRPFVKSHPHILPEVGQLQRGTSRIDKAGSWPSLRFGTHLAAQHTAPAAPPDRRIAAIPSTSFIEAYGSPSDPGERPSADPQTLLGIEHARNRLAQCPQTTRMTRAHLSKAGIKFVPHNSKQRQRPAPSNPPRLLNHLTRGSTHKSSESAAAMHGPETTTQHGSSSKATRARPLRHHGPGFVPASAHLRNAITKPQRGPGRASRSCLAALQRFLFQRCLLSGCMVAAVTCSPQGTIAVLIRCCDSSASSKNASVRKGGMAGNKRARWKQPRRNQRQLPRGNGRSVMKVARNVHVAVVNDIGIERSPRIRAQPPKSSPCRPLRTQTQPPSCRPQALPRLNRDIHSAIFGVSARGLENRLYE